MQLETHGAMVINMRRKTKRSWGTDIGYRFRLTRELGAGDKGKKSK
jgi:hypothetical protein